MSGKGRSSGISNSELLRGEWFCEMWKRNAYWTPFILKIPRDVEEVDRGDRTKHCRKKRSCVYPSRQCYSRCYVSQHLLCLMVWRSTSSIMNYATKRFEIKDCGSPKDIGSSNLNIFSWRPTAETRGMLLFVSWLQLVKLLLTSTKETARPKTVHQTARNQAVE